MRKPILLFTILIFFSNYLLAQNSMVGDGFGGRGWYVPHNYQVGAYSAYTVCGDSNQLYGWGRNEHGELGNGTTTGSNIPVAATGMSNVKFYTTGYVSSVIKNDGTVWVWGSYVSSPSGFSYTPTQILDNVKFADGGINHVVFVKNDGTVWGAGRNDRGQLGNGSISTTPLLNPVQMTGINNAVRAIAVGSGAENGCTVILLSDSTVKITGGGGYFQKNNSTIPVMMPGLQNIIDIKGNNAAVFALDAAGNVFAFGTDFEAAGIPVLGIGNFNLSDTAVPPTKLIFPTGASPIIALSSNNDGDCAMALDSAHNLYGWGENGFGQLGTGTSDHVYSPALISTNVIDVFTGENFSYILKDDSTLWCTGKSTSGGTSGGSIWMNLSNLARYTFTQIAPLIPPMNLCAPKVWGVVPVKLSSFTCVANRNTAYLNWQSAEETNANKYIVEYSSDGSSFKDIATVFARGRNSKYNYTHQQVSGTAFYRLKMMDKDGSFQYSEIRVVKFSSKAGITIAPNPANDVVYIFTKNNVAIKSIQIIAVDGQVVKVLNAYNTGQGISISNLARGTYILKAVYQNKEVEYGRFIKM